MIAIRKSGERGHFDHGWLDTYHTFSFGNYYDRAHSGFRSLRVINEDRVAPGQGFGMHPHRDMEIVTYVLDGALEHKDSMGHGAVLRPGEVQRISAGTGISHSEFNPSKTDPVHLLQIWLRPERNGLQPSYEQKSFSAKERDGRLRLVASPQGQDGSVKINQDAAIYAATLRGGQDLSHKLADRRHAWVQVTRGEATVNGETVEQGDGAAISDEQAVQIRAPIGAEVLLFDLA